MGYLKFVAYIYLLAGTFFIYEGVVAIQNNENSFLMFLLAGCAIFMFFFRRRFAKKFEERKKQK